MYGNLFFRKEIFVGATVAAGNVGLGIAYPPSRSMFILLGFAPIAALVSEAQLYVALLAGGAYQILYRIFLTMWFVRCYKIKTLSTEFVQPIGQSFHVVFY
ncbi:hypothetical protein [Peribacillus simplex]|uniref:Uncharacterized protein n=1 Tax=Peribacillus simplex TaxID=1478 RepID=A0A9W4PKA8_9BACI|nr:hypothetical protein [Peribacillus simplex]WHX93005.1 hypothetical protein QNH50_09245 [Peribacillus simplex]CAH0298338.1 hypothetical protein SRABI133_04477 [Peribacillus simplex]